MKGMVFTEFMEMVEAEWSLDMVDSIIEQSKVASGGVYTSVGSYPHEEMLALANALAKQTSIPVNDLIRAFGKHLFGRFACTYPHFFVGITDSFQFLSGIEDVIHAEVRKLYPDAELPTFEVESNNSQLRMIYFSDHPFADLAHGLIEGCLNYFGGETTLERTPIPALSGAQACFLITRQA